MKIAVCFSGQIRLGIEAAPNLLAYFGKYISNIDFFVHTWNITDYKPYSIINTGLPPARRVNVPVLTHPTTILSDERQTEFRKIYNPKIMIVEEFTNYIPVPKRSPLFYSWYKSIQLCKEYADKNNIKYDIVIKLRPDIIFPLHKTLELELTHFKKNTNLFYVDNYTKQRIDDVHWYSNIDNMLIASRYFDSSEDVSFETFMKAVDIKCCRTYISDYTPYRPECLKFDPIKYYKECFYGDRFWYSPLENIYE